MGTQICWFICRCCLCSVLPALSLLICSVPELCTTIPHSAFLRYRHFVFNMLTDMLQLPFSQPVALAMGINIIIKQRQRSMVKNYGNMVNKRNAFAK